MNTNNNNNDDGDKDNDSVVGIDERDSTHEGKSFNLTVAEVGQQRCRTKDRPNRS